MKKILVIKYVEGGIIMVNNSYRDRVKSIVSKAKEKGLTRKYSEYCKTSASKENTLSSEEVNYYTSKRKEVAE